MSAMPPPIADERAGLKEYVAAQQYAFKAIAFGLTDEQARSAPSMRSSAARCTSYQEASTVSTSGASAVGLVANNDMVKNFNIPTAGGVINARNVAITTTGLQAGGALASHGASVSLENGSVTTSGDQALGLSAIINGQISSRLNNILASMLITAMRTGVFMS